MASAFNRTERYLEGKPRWFSDRHEMRALAIQLLVARRLGLRLPGYEIIENATRNTFLFNKGIGYNMNTYWKGRFAKLVARTKKTVYVKNRVEEVLELIDKVKESGT